MTIRLELKPEVDAAPAEQAKLKGVPFDIYLREVIDDFAHAHSAALDRLEEMGKNLPHLSSSAFNLGRHLPGSRLRHLAPFLAVTNVLLRLTEPHDSDHAIDKLVDRGEQLCNAAQNLREFWNVCTRPAARLVAAMLVHGVSNLLTLNNRDLARYFGISAYYPRPSSRVRKRITDRGRLALEFRLAISLRSSRKDWDVERHGPLVRLKHPD